MSAKVIKKPTSQNGRVREVKESTQKKWSSSFEPGDVEGMIKAGCGSEKTIRRALNIFMASPETEAAINKFFASKKQTA